MKKQKIVKVMMMTAILTGSMMAGQSYFNKTQASGKEARCCAGSGKACSNWLCNEDKSQYE